MLLHTIYVIDVVADNDEIKLTKSLKHVFHVQQIRKHEKTQLSKDKTRRYGNVLNNSGEIEIYIKLDKLFTDVLGNIRAHYKCRGIRGASASHLYAYAQIALGKYRPWWCSRDREKWPI